MARSIKLVLGCIWTIQGPRQRRGRGANTGGVEPSKGDEGKQGDWNKIPRDAGQAAKYVKLVDRLSAETSHAS